MAASRGRVQTDSWITGTCELEGRRITITATGGFCGGGRNEAGLGTVTSPFAFSWDAGIVRDGRMEAVHLGAHTDTRETMGGCTLPIGERFGLTRVSPTSATASAIDPGFHVGDLTDASTVADLQGFWLVEGTSYLLRLEFSGSYHLDDGGGLASNPDDVGVVTVGRRRVTFISGTGSVVCSEGDVLRLRDVVVEDGALRGVVAGDRCGCDIGGEVTLLYLDILTP